MCGGSCMSDLEPCPLFEMESNNWTARIKQQLNSMAYSGDKCPEESSCVVFEQYIKNRFASYAGEQVTGEPVGEVRAVSGMHERKDEMVRSADAFIALPV